MNNMMTNPLSAACVVSTSLNDAQHSKTAFGALRRMLRVSHDMGSVKAVDRVFDTGETLTHP